MMGEIADNRQAVERVVEERAGWVFAAARRRVKDAALAEDVTQAVFLLYWRRRAGEMRPGKVAGWLHRAVRYCSANALRLKQIQQRHEREAAMQKKERIEGMEGMAEWTEVEAELEGAMDRLSEKDRDVVLLRFYEQRPLAEVGKALGISEEAAKKRVQRAVGKLQEMLGKKGISGTTAGLSAVLVGNVVGQMPEHLVEKIVSAVGNGGGNTVATAIAKGAMKMMTYAKVKMVAVLAAGVLLVSASAVVGTGWTAGQVPTQTAATQASTSGWIVRLPGGAAQVELAGVSENPVGVNGWWRPDGNASGSAISDGFLPNRVSVDSGERALQFSLRCTGLPDDTRVQWRITPGRRSANAVIISGRAAVNGNDAPGIREALAVFPVGQATANVQVTIFAGPQTVMVVDSRGKLVRSPGKPETMMTPHATSEEQPRAPLVFKRPGAWKATHPDAQGMATLWLQGSGAGVDVSASAITKDGASHAMSTWNSSIGLDNGQPGYAIGFDVGLDSVDRFEVRLRQPGYMVTFENVSLDPRNATNVTAHVEKAMPGASATGKD